MQVEEKDWMLSSKLDHVNYLQKECDYLRSQATDLLREAYFGSQADLL
jgi:hypothetical protein